MTANFHACDPDEHEYMLAVTMPLKNWRKLRKQICGDRVWADYPGSEIVREIDNMVQQAEKVYYPRLPAPNELDDLERDVAGK